MTDYSLLKKSVRLLHPALKPESYMLSRFAGDKLYFISILEAVAEHENYQLRKTNIKCLKFDGKMSRHPPCNRVPACKHPKPRL